MKYILKGLLIMLALYSFVRINNKYDNKQISTLNLFDYANVDIIPVQNTSTDLGQLVIPNHNTTETIYDDNINSKVSIAMGSDYLTKEDGKIILNSILSLKELALEEHLIINVENTCYVFKIIQIGSMSEYKDSLELSSGKALYVLNDTENIFIKAVEFYTNNTNDLT